MGNAVTHFASSKCRFLTTKEKFLCENGPEANPFVYLSLKGWEMDSILKFSINGPAVSYRQLWCSALNFQREECGVHSHTLFDKEFTQ